MTAERARRFGESLVIALAPKLLRPEAKMYPYILRGKLQPYIFQATVGSPTTRDSAIGFPITCDRARAKIAKTRS